VGHHVEGDGLLAAALERPLRFRAEGPQVEVHRIGLAHEPIEHPPSAIG
jgi:hypothetical protein